MAQSLELNIKTTSDVPQAMDKAKSATVSFGKQVEDIQKKFSTAFKDVFLSFLGPLALLGVAINYIGKLIDENKKKHEEANQAAIDGTNELMSAEDRYWARKQDREKKTKETEEQAKTAREDVTREFLKTDPRGRQMLFDFAESQRRAGSDKYGPGFAAENKAMQDKVQALLAEEAKKNPQAGAVIVDKKSENFKGPEGFSNVVGVGPNPVMEAMNAQLDEARKTNALLEKIAGDPGATSWMNSTPSRAALLMGK
jgi:hypothetical protein